MQSDADSERHGCRRFSRRFVWTYNTTNSIFNRRTQCFRHPLLHRPRWEGGNRSYYDWVLRVWWGWLDYHDGWNRFWCSRCYSRSDFLIVCMVSGLIHVFKQAISSLIERPAPGLVHLMLAASLKQTHLASLSRPVAGTLKNTLITTLPGSVKAVKENMDALLQGGLISHALDLIKGGSGQQLHARLQSGDIGRSEATKVHEQPHHRHDGHHHHHHHHHHHEGGEHHTPKPRSTPSLSHNPSEPGM